MEQLNRIELRGNVGNAYLNNIGESQMVRFSLATNYVYKGRDGQAVIETTWHNITAWEGKGMPDFTKISKGTCVHVFGRLRTYRFMASDGNEKQNYEVIASRLEIEESQPAAQFGPTI